MGLFSKQYQDGDINNKALDKIISWATSLNFVTAKIPSVQVFHGYTGRWEWISTFEKWSGIDIHFPDFVRSKGFWDLVIPREGSQGYGSSQAEVFAKVNGCYATFKNNEKISNIECKNDGSLRFQLEVFDRHLTSQRGDPPQRQGFQELIEGPPVQIWEFTVDKDNTSSLTGFRFDQIQGVKQKVTAIKVH
jgi:hypothetical protein